MDQNAPPARPLGLLALPKSVLGLAKEAARHLLRRPVVGVVAAGYTPDDRWLLIRRGDTGEWALPGGTLEWGETLRRGLARELLEEAGVADAEVERVVGVYSAPERDPRFHAVTVVVRARIAPPTRAPVNPLEIRDVRLFPRAELPTGLAMGMDDFIAAALRGGDAEFNEERTSVSDVDESEHATLEGGIDLAPHARTRADELAARLERLRASYYAGAPDVSDAAYDALEDELRAIDPTHPVLAKVGAEILVSEWPKARHELPMGSLNKAVSEEELRAWLTRCEELLAKEGKGPVGGALFVAEKLDGISIEVIYRDGRLADAITRGDGDVGERITQNVARMKGIPARIPGKESLSFRGEIILRLSDMKRPIFAGVTSPRNAAAGTSKRFDGQGSEHLTVLFYEVADHVTFATEREKFAWLRAQGLATPRTTFGGIDDVLAVYKRYGDGVRAGLDYEIDGLVVYVDDLEAQALLGDVNHRPRGAVAFKFASPAKVTRVLAVSWDTGPSGRITPVALVAPVELAGATVQRASLHNAANVRALGIGPGDEVLVSRRNDVIPYVEEVVERRGESAQPPTACPRCGAPIVSEGEYLVCRNPPCPALVEGRIQSWVGAINALEWGEKLVAQLVESGKVKEPADLYRLGVDDIASLDRRGEKSAKKCLAELAARLPVTLPVFLAGLGMESFALQTARLLVAAGYTTLPPLLAAKDEELAAIPGLGAIKAANIVRGLAARREDIQHLLDVGVVPVPPEEQGPLAGLTFCFTGASSRPRGELTALVEKAGGRVLSGVTKDLRYLVIADPESTSSKAVKARKYGTQLITEEGLDALIAEKSEPKAPP